MNLRRVMRPYKYVPFIFSPLGIVAEFLITRTFQWRDTRNLGHLVSECYMTRGRVMNLSEQVPGK